MLAPDLGHHPATTHPGIRAALEAGDPVAWTRAMVAVPTVNPELEAGGAGEAPLADLLLPWLERWGFRVERREPVPGRVTLVAERGAGAPVLGLCGHLDTVGVAGMEIDPFDPVLEAGGEEGGVGATGGERRILGRGSADMKAGVAAILAVAARTAPGTPEPRGAPRRGSGAAGEQPGAIPGTLRIVLTSDEEHASLGLRDVLDAGFQAEAVVVTEPTELALAPASKGFAWYTVTAHGRAAHGSRPELGRDAIRQMGRVLAALDHAPLLAETTHPLLGAASIHAGTISGGVAPSVYPASCRLELEARLLPGETGAQVAEALQSLLRDVEARHPQVPLSLETGMERPSAELGGDHPLAAGLAAALEAEGMPPRLEGMTAWVESAWFMEAGIPALCFGPGSIAQAHTARESVPVHEIEVAARVLERWVRRGGRG
jgi:acetylornithine deacetylase